MDLRSMIGWFGVLLAAACVMVGLVAVFLGFTAHDPQNPGSDSFVIPIAMLFLKPVAFASMATGAVGLFWPSLVDAQGHNFRSWVALLTGGGAAVVSLMFGPSF